VATPQRSEDADVTQSRPAPRPRFRIDPREAASAPPPAPVAPSVPERVVATPVPPAPASPPPAAPLPAAPAQRRRMWLYVGVATVVVLLVGGVVAAGLMTGAIGPSYPKRYLVASSETPHGLTLSAVPQQATDEFDVTSNPGKVGDRGLQTLTLPDGTAPTEAWAEAFDSPSGGLRSITLVASKFGSNDDASNWADQTSSALCTSFGETHVLVDGSVVVLLTARDRLDALYVGKLVSTLEGKASGLRDRC
jgi:hypothetical protein